MNDKIRVSTEWLNESANRLTDIAGIVNSAKDILASTDTSERSGGQVNIDLRYHMTQVSDISGDTIAALIKSVQRTMSETERVINDLGGSCRKSAQIFENAEDRNEQTIDDIGTGRVPEKGTGVLSVPSTPWIEGIFGSERLHQKEWEEQDEFINTQYSKDLIERLHDAIVNDPRFSKSEWNKCTTRAEKEAFLRSLIDRLNEIYGTDLTGGVVFEYPGQTSTLGTYRPDSDSILINNADTMKYDSLLSTLTHEFRHNLQWEIIHADNLDQYSNGSQEDAEAIDRMRTVWGNEWENYVNYKARKQELLDEYERNATWWNKLNPLYDNKKEIYSDTTAFHEYAEQQLEVDARYTENHVSGWLKEQSKAEKAAIRQERAEEKARQYTDTIADPFDGVIII